MRNPGSSSFLRRALLADAITCVAAGLLMLLLMLLGAGPLETLLGLPPALLGFAGMLLLPFAALVAFTARSDPISRPLVWLVIVSNAIWTVDSILLLLSRWVTPTMLGTAFVIVQAIAAGIFAELEYFGLRRARAAAA